jgi:hypothetical protein
VESKKISKIICLPHSNPIYQKTNLLTIPGPTQYS